MREISIPSPLRCETVASSMLVTLSGRVFQLEETTSHQQWGNKNISLSLNGKSRYEGFHSWWVQWLCITVFGFSPSYFMVLRWRFLICTPRITCHIQRKRILLMYSLLAGKENFPKALPDFCSILLARIGLHFQVLTVWETGKEVPSMFSLCSGKWTLLAKSQ